MLPGSLTDGHRSDDVAGCQTLSWLSQFLKEVPVRHNGTFRLVQFSGGRAALESWLGWRMQHGRRGRHLQRGGGDGACGGGGAGSGGDSARGGGGGAGGGSDGTRVNAMKVTRRECAGWVGGGEPSTWHSKVMTLSQPCSRQILPCWGTFCARASCAP